MRNLFFKIARRIFYSPFFGDVKLAETLLKNIPANLERYIDVGAYDGKFFEEIYKNKKVFNTILIEPQKDLYEKLIDKYKNNNSIVVKNLLLSDKSGEVLFYINKLGATSSVFEFDQKLLKNDIDSSCMKQEIIQTSTLDILLANDDKKIDLLKIDVQGSELNVLMGAEKSLHRTGYIWLEVSFVKIYKNGPSFEEIQIWLNNRGFSLMEILPGYQNSKGELIQADCLFKNTQIDL
jgi:FkbM family methyltransferase